jgi:hypothetical protein
MGTVLGFLVGYYLGVKAGPKGYDELQEAWATISSSDEAKALVTGGLAVGRDLVRRSAGVLASRLADSEPALRRVA